MDLEPYHFIFGTLYILSLSEGMYDITWHYRSSSSAWGSPFTTLQRNRV